MCLQKCLLCTIPSVGMLSIHLKVPRSSDSAPARAGRGGRVPHRRGHRHHLRAGARLQERHHPLHHHRYHHLRQLLARVHVRHRLRRARHADHHGHRCAPRPALPTDPPRPRCARGAGRRAAVGHAAREGAGRLWGRVRTLLPASSSPRCLAGCPSCMAADGGGCCALAAPA